MKRKTALVIGFGLTGLAAAKLLRSQGYSVRITEASCNDVVKERLLSLPENGIDIELGAHSRNFCKGCDFAILSPGVSPKAKPAKWILEEGKPLWSEIEWAARSIEGKIIAVTGSYGKTTTVFMIEEMFRRTGISCTRAGNSHEPLSLKVLENPDVEYWIVEVSSYQLELLQDFKPWISIILNVFPHHLDRHRSLKQYRMIKMRMLKNFNKNGIGILHSALLPFLPETLKQYMRNMIWVGDMGRKTHHHASYVNGKACLHLEKITEELFPIESVHLSGAHNLSNAIFAAVTAHYCGVASSTIADTLNKFKGLVHRQEVFAHYGNAVWVNDSKATGVPAVKSALENFQGPILWIAGGSGVGKDFSELYSLVKKKVKMAFFYGTDRHVLMKMFSPYCPVQEARDLDAVVHMLNQEIQGGKIVLLSPGVQSFDQFTNFEERGCFYKACVARLWTDLLEKSSEIGSDITSMA